jgi:hypothetical protein
MKRVFACLTITLTVSAFATRAQTNTADTVRVSRLAPQSRTFFPHNWIRGYTDFSVAPSHNEPDLGRCMFPQPASAGGTASTCTAYARYLYSGYIELQPLGRTPARHFFLFFEPKFSFGRNIPQLTYTASMRPIAYDRSIGIGFQLPKNFEIRATQHQRVLRPLRYFRCTLVLRRLRSSGSPVGVLTRILLRAHVAAAHRPATAQRPFVDPRSYSFSSTSLARPSSW